MSLDFFLPFDFFFFFFLDLSLSFLSCRTQYTAVITCTAGFLTELHPDHKVATSRLLSAYSPYSACASCKTTPTRKKPTHTFFFLSFLFFLGLVDVPPSAPPGPSGGSGKLCNFTRGTGALRMNRHSRDDHAAFSFARA